MMRLAGIFFGLFLFAFHPSQAQEKCATAIREQQLHPASRTAELEQWIQAHIQKRFQQGLGAKTQASSYTVPVVVHIIHNGEAIGSGTNIPNAQVFSQIDVLNKDYQRLNADAGNTPPEFKPVAGSINVQFVLAKQDPSGNPTNGIVRVKGTQTSWTYNDESKFKALSYWPAENYLNIWVISFSDSFIGFAQLPLPGSTGLGGLDGSSSERLTDGVVIHYKAFGSNSNGFGTFNLFSQFAKGRTATHEVGHFFGLRHIWGDDSNCSTTTDYVDDTPKQNANTNGCPPNPQSSCSTEKMFQNYMDYTDDACMNLFTQGQVQRMDIIINNATRRKSLLSSQGATAPTGSPITDVTLSGLRSPGPVVCTGTVTPVITVVNSGTTTISSLSVSTTLNNATPATQNFNGLQILPGDELDVTLNAVTLPQGTATITFALVNPNNASDNNITDNAVTINEVFNASADVVPLRQNFNTDFSTWTIASTYNSQSWEVTTTNTPGFQKSMVYKAFNYAAAGRQSWLVSPVLDFSSISEASVFFDVSYALRSASAAERLQVFSSTDCGVTYNEVQFDEIGNQFNDARISSTSWQPAVDKDWQTQFVNLDDLTGQKNVRLAFVVTNANGNNLYLDNIEFFQSDTSTPPAANTPYTIYLPGETLQQYAITFNLNDRADVRVLVYNMVGQKMAEHNLSNVLNQTYPIEFSHAESGLYIVQVQIGGEASSTKIFVSR